MTPVDHRRASDLFGQVRELPESQRSAALEAACAGNPELRAQVLLLLEGDRGAAAVSFLDRPAMLDAARFAAEGGTGRLAPGARLGPYTITGRLGAGGMGEVYRARDSRLDRDVAVKVLPALLAADAEYLARFAREAQVLALLSHPNVAVIHGLEERALIMELVEGPTLAERIARGPLSLEDAAEIASQVAAALEAVHEKGLVHRDLKPANVKVTPEGRVKVLDFGLARHRESDSGSREPLPPTGVSEGSMAGVIVGTAAYMSPEQAKGRVVDRRVDIWAFGVVLYEMLTGRNPFRRETVPETLAAVLKGEIDFEPVPRAARAIVERCLRKDPRRRWQSIGDARIALEEALASGAPEATAIEGSRWRQRLGWAAMGGMAVAAVLAILAYPAWRSQNTVPPAVQFAVNSPDNGSALMEPMLRVSPDGKTVLFLARSPDDHVTHVYLYSIAKGATRALPGTEGVADAFWSYDSRALLLSRSGQYTRTDIDGNSSQPLAFESGYSSWGPNGVVSAVREGLQWFRPEAPGSRLMMRNDIKTGENLIVPTLGPGGRWILYNVFDGTPSSGVSVRVASLDGKEQHKVFTSERAAIYAGTNSGSGYALYLRGPTLMARAIDSRSGQAAGDPFPIAGPVERPLGSVDTGTFSASNNGVLAFARSASSDYRLVWFDRSGKRLGTAGEVGDYSNPALSPDGKRLAISIRDPGTGNRDIWVFDLLRGAASRITFDAADHTNPVWSPDGGRVAFSSDRRGARDIYIKDASGTGSEELVIESRIPKNVEDWSRDGRWLVYNEAVPNNSDDLVAIPLDSRKPVDILRTRFQEDKGHFSPDGKWLAYQSNESGKPEVYIQPFPRTGQKWQISNGNGGQPQWRADGKELFYSAFTMPAGVMAVNIAAKNNAIHAGIPHRLFEAAMQASGARNRWVATSDGQKFLVVTPVNEKPVHNFTVIVNWPALLPTR